MPDSFDYPITNSENARLLQALIDEAPSYTQETNSRNAEILKSIINNTEYTDAPQSEIEELLLRLKVKIGGEIEVDELTVTENGIYNAGVNKAYNPVTVELPLDSKTITENGTYTASDDSLEGFDEVTVAVEGYAKKSIPNTPCDIATFNASALPMPSLTVGIEATQDLHGYDRPWAGGAGKNKLQNVASSTTGITVNTDGSIVVNGTFSQRIWFRINSSVTLPAGTYTLSGVPLDAPSGLTLYDDSSFGGWSNGNTKTFSEEITGQIMVRIIEGTYNNVLIKPQIEEGSTATSFAPYSNICPISGFSAVNVPRTSINVFDEVMELGTINSDGESAPATNRVRTKNYISVKSGVTYYAHTNGYLAIVTYYNLNKVRISSENLSDSTFTAPIGACYLRFIMSSSYGTTYNNDISINYPSTDTSYHAYNGTTYTIDLDGTRYGCTLDVVSGELTVDRVEIIYDGSNDENWSLYSGKRFIVPAPDFVSPAQATMANILCDKLVTIPKSSQGEREGVISGSDAGTAYIMVNVGVSTVEDLRTWLTSNPIQVVYEKATPQTIQLTPTAVKSIAGTNNLWADSGNIQSGEYMEAL